MTPTRIVVVALCLAAGLSAHAQLAPVGPAANTDGAVKLEAFVVTGSNIKRVDAETALPVTVIEAADLDARGAATMAELFETLGAADISAITELNNGPQLARQQPVDIQLHVRINRDRCHAVLIVGKEEEIPGRRHPADHSRRSAQGQAG